MKRNFVKRRIGQISMQMSKNNAGFAVALFSIIKQKCIQRTEKTCGWKDVLWFLLPSAQINVGLFHLLRVI